MMEEIIDIFRKRNISAYFVKDRKEALITALDLIPQKAAVGFGGSVTLEQVGILDELRKRTDITLLDRSRVQGDELIGLYAKIFSADVFLSGANAITKKGQIVNVDGIGNRVAAITFGPKKVIIIAGINKITSDLDSALKRIRNIALVKNMERVKGRGWTEENLWGQVSIIERQRNPDRMHLIIVNEELGF